MCAETKFNELTSGLNATIKYNQEDYLYFGGTAYLGIPQNEAFKSLFITGINTYGINNGTSRGNNVQLGIYNAAERFIANKFDAEEALVISSGYLSAKLTVSAYANEGEVRYAPHTHPALWLNGNPQNSGEFKIWATELVLEINQSEKKDWVIITNSMNNLVPEVYDFSFLKAIDSSKNIRLIVDDSHGIGILNNGLSVWQSIPKLANVETVVAASMAKALGLDAGVVFGNTNSILKLKQSDEFYGASPPPAAFLYAFINADTIYKSAFAKLIDNVSYFAKAIEGDRDWSYVAGFPVFLSNKQGIEEKLQAQKILISSFPYPDKNGKKLNRIVISCWHSKADLDKLLAAVRA